MNTEKILIDGLEVELSDDVFEHNLFEMATYRHDKMEMPLPCNIWAKTYNVKNDLNKTPFLKFQINKNILFEPYNMADMTISKTDPQIFSKKKLDLTASEINQLKEWVKANYDVLMQYWKMEIDSYELAEAIYKKHD